MVLGGNDNQLNPLLEQLTAIQHDHAKRIERLESLEHTNFGMGCWRVLDRDDGGQFTGIPNNSPDYPSLAILYNVKGTGGAESDLLMRWNGISTATYEGIYINLDNALAAPVDYEIVPYSGATSVVMGKVPPAHNFIFHASGIIFWPNVQRGQEVPPFGINACIDFSEDAGNRFKLGLYGGFNTGTNTCPVTDIRFSLSAGNIRAGSYFVLYEICDILDAEGGS